MFLADMFSETPMFSIVSRTKKLSVNTHSIRSTVIATSHLRRLKVDSGSHDLVLPFI